MFLSKREKTQMEQDIEEVRQLARACEFRLDFFGPTVSGRDVELAIQKHVANDHPEIVEARAIRRAAMRAEDV